MRKSVKSISVICIAFLLLSGTLFAKGNDDNRGSDERGNKNKKQELRQEKKKESDYKGDKDQMKIRIREKTMLRLKTCTDKTGELKQMVKSQARDMTQTHSRIREKVHALINANEEFVNNLPAEEKSRVKTQLREMGKIQTRLKNNADAMDKELTKNDYSENKIKSRLKNMEKEAVKLQNQYRAMEWILQED